MSQEAYFDYPKILPEEVSVKMIVPALRAAVAMELEQSHSLSQAQIAELLGVSQPAVSFYLSRKRGSYAQYAMKAKFVKKLISEIAGMMTASKNRDQRKIIAHFNEAIEFIKGYRLLCAAHKKLEPELNLWKCHICDSFSNSSP